MPRRVALVLLLLAVVLPDAPALGQGAAIRPATAPATLPAQPGDDAAAAARGAAGLAGFVIQSHRGAGDLAPENTLEAFELAWKLGTYPEADLRTTRDGVIVAFHDDNFARVVRDADDATKKKGVADVTWDELSRLDVGAYKGKQFEGQRVATLAQALGRMAGRPERRLYLDIKHVDLRKVAGEVKAHEAERQVIVASTDYALLRRWKALAPESGTLLWMGGTEDALRKRIADLHKAEFADVTQLQVHVRLKGGKPDPAGPDPFTPSDAFLAEVGRELRGRGITYQCLPWGSKDPRVYWKLLDLGVVSFATDHPDVTVDAVRRYYAERAPRGQ